MNRSVAMPMIVAGLAVIAGGWLLQEGVDRAENVYVRVRVLQEVVDRVESSFVEDVSSDALYSSAIDGLIRDLDDPHSSFLPADEYENLRIRSVQGEYGGVGLEVVERNGLVTVVSPIPSTPGARAGIRAGDQFHEIDGVLADTMTTDQAVDLLRGRPGTEVSVKMHRPGVAEPIPFSIERATITLRAVPYAVLLDGDVGYVPLQSVRESSAQEIRQAVDSLREEGMKSLVLDLRGNPGGLLDQGIAVSDLFLDAGLDVVETRGRAPGQSETYAASGPDRYPDLPVAVLIDGSSASASEIIAGALQDHDRAAVIGETSYGKGSVQSLFRLTGGDVLRLTTAKWFTPVGRSIDRDPEAATKIDAHVLSISGEFVLPTVLEGRPTFESASGRLLYGGGGITPDLFVEPETLSGDEIYAVQNVFQQAGGFTVALFNFAVEYVQGHPDLELGFSVTDADLEALFVSLSDHEAEVDRESFRTAERFVRYHLEREIALQAWGEVEQFRQSLRFDRQLQRAVELLDDGLGTDALLEAVGAAEASGAGARP